MRYLLALWLLLALPLQADIEKELLIIGCARSGTTYITKVLRACGLDVKHEHMGSQGMVSWCSVFEDYLPPWGDSSKGYCFKHIFHQVRHPLSVISSVHTTEPEASWLYITAHIPRIEMKDSHLVKCVKYWIYWNLEAEKKAEWTYRVEELGSILELMGDKLGYPLSQEAMLSISTQTNGRGPYPHIFTWKELKYKLPKKLYKKLVALATRYGYSTVD